MTARTGILVSLYPAVSHTFIRREVDALRSRGMEIHTFSIRRPDAGQILSEEDRAAVESTWYVLPVPFFDLVRAHAGALFQRPGRYLRTLGTALRHRLPGLRSALWALFYFAEAIVLARELERRGIGHLHGHFANAASAMGLLATGYLGIGWSLTLHGSADFDSERRPLLGEQIRAARFVACVSDYGRAQAMRAVDPSEWPKLFVSRCGIELDEWSLPARPEKHRSRFRILTVGRLSTEKGHLGLLGAFEQLVARGVDAELRIVGHGPEETRLRMALAQRRSLWGRVSLLGALPEVGVAGELQQADLFALSSLMEGLPVVLMEAMAAGVPVVAPRLAGIPELVEDGCTGRLYTPARWDELAERIGELLESPEDRVRLARNARRAVESRHSLERAIEPLWKRLQHVG